MWRWLVIVLALACAPACADTPLTLFKTWTGNVNFTGTVVTNRNNFFFSPCSVYGSNTTLSVALAGIPASATVLSAQLYWAGSGDTPDYTVGFESGNVTSTRARSYTSSSVGSNYDYFSGAADVTAQVVARRNGNYQFYGLTADTGSPYCAAQAVVSGFALLVVYSDASQPYRVLNLYEGFQYYRNNGFSTTMSGFRVPALTSGITGRIGHITWEGDAATSGSEDLTMNGVRMTDSMNPAGNQFNSQSNITGNTASYGIDFDAYDVGSSAIAAGQTSATTTYQTGNDMVLLSAQMIALPSSPPVDLSLTMTRNGPFTVGNQGSYTLSIFNNGPSTEVGPIRLVNTLPAGVSFVSAGGTRWSCSASGQVVTCNYNGLFTVNTYLPDITLTVLPTAVGSITNTASMSGINYDTDTSNNSNSDTTTVTRGTVSYVFTDSACKPNVAFGTAGQCSLVAPDQRLPAAASVDGFLTGLSGGVPVARSTTASTTVPISFAMTCVLPLKNAGVKATVNGTQLPLCADGPAAPGATSDAWSAALSLVFAANAPSSKITLYYADVGKVMLSAREAGGAVSSSPTVVYRPDALRLEVNGTTANASSGSAPLLAAGAPFTIKVDALMSNGVAAPNFGNGDASVTVALPAALPTATADDRLIAAAMGNLPALATTWNGAAGGVFTGSATFTEVGVPTLIASVTGGYFGVANDVRDAVLKVGRFYPASFQTVVTPNFVDCSKISKLPVCPAEVRGASYATQNFAVRVIPLDVNGEPVQNFRGVFGDQLELTAVASAGAASVLAPGVGVLSAPRVPALPASGSPEAMVVNASFALATPFDAARPATTAWSASLPIFLRATAEKAVDSGGQTRLSSKQAVKSLEDGVMILNGRLRLGTVPGSELLRLPVTMDAQFWYKPATGAGVWTGNIADTGATPTTIAFSRCRRKLQVGDACDSNLKMVPKDAAFTAGSARFFIAPPGAGKTGSAMFNMTGAPAWLPSTLAQAVFGIYKSNFIYLRERY